jgi:haloalkane dehalogenase
MMQRREFMALSSGLLAAGALPTAISAILPAAAGDSSDAREFLAARRHVRTPFGDIACVERGTGDAALFLHGFPLNGFQWRGALARLSPYRRCIAPDFMGLGYTQVVEGQSVAPDAQVAMLVALMDALDVDIADVVANDSGGAVAQLLLVRHPQRVRSILLTNCDAEIDCPPAALLPVIELAKNGKFVDEWLAPWLADKELARSPQGLGGLTFTHPRQLADSTIDYYLSPLVDQPAQTHAYAIALATNVLAGIEPVLKQSRVPARIVWGTGDDIFSPDSADYLDRSLGGSRGVQRVPGAKLFFPEEFPDLIASEARQLWDIAEH